MPQSQHINRHNLPALTWEQYLQKSRQIFRRSKTDHDWSKVFLEWVTSEPSEFNGPMKWIKAKYPEIKTLQKSGGRSFWTEARWAFREKGLIKAIEKIPDALAKKFEKQLRIIGKLEDVIEKSADKLLAGPVAPQEPPEGASEQERKEYERDLREYKIKKESLNEEAIKTLAEATAKLAETNISLSNDGVQKHEVKSINLVAAVVESIKNRDAKFGITD